MRRLAPPLLFTLAILLDTSQLALTAMGALVTVWGVFAIWALRRKPADRPLPQAA
ncbi:hypothetical protein [Deinococcus terrestris]|uniref:hypothetical protein n=1 Tax=Deinococcus terrestris TaxID=2651870 RepID=UPI0018835AF1|nr:hypothetical protein [Deinococcus terrestris]